MKDKLHILVLSSWYPTAEQPFLGNFVKRHVDLLAQKHQVTVLNLQSDTDVSSITEETKTTGNLTEIFVRYPAAGNPFSKWKNARKAFKQGVQHIQPIDLIHGNVILSKGLQFLWAKKHFNKPLIVTEHASYFRKAVSDNWSWKDKIIVKKVIQHADCITAVSPFLKSEIQAVFPELKVEILPNVIDPNVFSLVPKQATEIPQFVHVSTLDERYKNISGIIAACEKLKAEMGTVFQLLVISDEPYEKWVLQVKASKLDDCIRFAGPMSPKSIAEALQKADALVLFSHYETFSCVVAESWSTGTPVISTPVGIATQLDSELGIQVADNDVEALKNALKSFVLKSEKYDAEKISAQATAYYPEKVLKVMEDLYASLLK